MTKSLGITASRVLLVAAFSVAWFPQSRAQAGNDVKKTLLSIPGVTGEQKNRISDLTNVARMQSAPLREQVTACRKYIATLWAADAVDTQAIARKQGELDGAVNKLRTIWADLFLQLHDLLTPPQRTWLAARASNLYSDLGGEWTAGSDCRCASQR
jgi:Spy/CpxP family protein refolding chaperone